MTSPSSLHLFIGAALGAVVAIGACGGDVVIDGGSTSTTGSSAGGAPSTNSTSSTGGTGGGLAAGQCRSVNDCMLEDVCVPPGASPPCAVCVSQQPCGNDADCAADGATFICTTVACGCPPQQCTPGCTSDAVCAMGETCASSHHCVPTACTSDGDCLVNFDCISSACQRRACTGDAACSGYCVTGSCYDAPGMCTGPEA